MFDEWTGPPLRYFPTRHNLSRTKRKYAPLKALRLAANDTKISETPERENDK